MRWNAKPRALFALGVAVGFSAAAVTLSGLISAGPLNPPPEAVNLDGDPEPTMTPLDELPPTWSPRIDDQNRRFVPALISEGYPSIVAILDKETGLVWEKTPLDTPLADPLTAMEYCYSQQLGGRFGWRLPRVEELASVAPGEGQQWTVIDALESIYWTSTLKPGTAHNYVVSHEAGAAQAQEWLPDYGPVLAWCVRSGNGSD